VAFPVQQSLRRLSEHNRPLRAEIKNRRDLDQTGKALSLYIRFISFINFNEQLEKLYDSVKLIRSKLTDACHTGLSAFGIYQALPSV
jgi:hypothetical protein